MWVHQKKIDLPVTQDGKESSTCPRGKPIEIVHNHCLRECTDQNFGGWVIPDNCVRHPAWCSRVEVKSDGCIYKKDQCNQCTSPILGYSVSFGAWMLFLGLKKLGGLSPSRTKVHNIAAWSSDFLIKHGVPQTVKSLNSPCSLSSYPVYSSRWDDSQIPWPGPKAEPRPAAWGSGVSGNLKGRCRYLEIG